MAQAPVPSQGRRARILLPEPLPGPLDYRIPPELDIELGDLVEVPLGNRRLIGCVWELPNEAEPPIKAGTDTDATAEPPSKWVPFHKLKPIIARLEVPSLQRQLRRWIDWSAHYLCAPPGLLLRMALRSPLGFAEIREETVFVASGIAPARMNEARARVLACAQSTETPLTASQLAEMTQASQSVVHGLAKAGALKPIRRSVDPPFQAPDPDFHRPILSPSQAAASAQLCEAFDAQNSGDASATAPPILLDGVTGSGKTEVYFEAIGRALAVEGAQILVLLPEIALTQDVLARFETRFGARPAEWHSEISNKNRRRAWREIVSGRARIIVGARSALFLPFRQLALIIVDEEHDHSFKQDEGVHYQARDLAVVRAKMENAVLILASATPSLETMQNAAIGRYRHVKLPARAQSASLPEIGIIDMRADPPPKNQWLSPMLIQAAQETLDRGEQVLLFLNRRGYAPLVVCRACGDRLKAPDSDSWLVEHRYTGRLVCHLTGFSMPKPRFCPKCHAPDPFIGIGPGVERVHEEAQSLFPQARIAIFSSDTTLSSADARQVVNRMKNGEIDIMIGTQIAAKGHNFPALTLVGVIDADMGLKGGDLRAGERTFQLLSQVAGRSGRASRPGRALLQTYAPEHDAMRALAMGDRDGFLEQELAMRQATGLPPFGRLAALILSAPNEAEAELASATFAQAAPRAEGVDVWGPAIPPLGMIRGQYRRRFLVRSDRQIDLSAFMSAWRSRVKARNAWRVTIDIEPYHFL